MIAPRPTFYVPIHGTWAIDEKEIAWWKTSGAFSQFSARNNVFQLESQHPFVWSSDISGFKYNLTSGNAKHTDWRAGGYALAYYLQNTHPSNRNLIIHSHGLQVVAYAAVLGVQFNNIITICSPVRNDLKDAYEILNLKTNRWLHIYDNSDFIQILGQFGDGRWFGSRKVELRSVQNELLKDINHTDVLKVGARMDYWVKRGWFDFLRQ